MQAGLVSVTFRSLTWRQTLELARQAGLTAIEWGGDIHVPHGDLTRARQVGEATCQAGLRVAAYGSYYRLGQDHPAFCDVLATARALGAPAIRVWAGACPSDQCSEAQWAALIEDARRITHEALAAGITVVFEYHRNTLTDTADACGRLLGAVPGAMSYWQPPVDMPADACLLGLRRLDRRLAGVHTFSWQGVDRLPLRAREHDWLRFLAQAQRQGAPWALLEFVQDDSPAQLLEDARTLRRWLAQLDPSTPNPSEWR